MITELGKLYREARRGEIEAYQATRLASLLRHTRSMDITSAMDRERLAIGSLTRSALARTLSFCERWRVAGGEVHVDTVARFTHQGLKSMGSEAKT